MKKNIGEKPAHTTLVKLTQVSISPTFFKQLLLRAQIPKVQKDTYALGLSFVLLGSELVKAASKTLVKLTPEIRTTPDTSTVLTTTKMMMSSNDVHHNFLHLNKEKKFV